MVAATGNPAQFTTNEPVVDDVIVGGFVLPPLVALGVSIMIELEVTLTLEMVVFEDEHAADPYHPGFAPDPALLSPPIGATLYEREEDDIYVYAIKVMVIISSLNNKCPLTRRPSNSGWRRC
jgi:hypothetical protein